MIKKLVFNIFLVVAVVYVMDFAIGRTLSYFYFNEIAGLHFRTTYSMETTKADVLIFGSSRANHHYVPEVFEDSLKMSYYNTGRDGNGIFFQTAVLRSVLKRYTPEVIILDYAGGFEREDKVYDRLSSLVPYYRTHEEIRKIIELKSPFEKVKLISNIYPFNSQIGTIAIGNLQYNKKRKSDNKGYVALYKEWSLEIDSVNISYQYEPDSNKINSFREFIETAKQSGAKTVVIFSPFFQKFDVRQEIEICRKLCAIDNVPFYDFSKDTLFLNNKHLFQDPAHLNHNGATIFSNIIVNQLQESDISN